MNLNLIKPLSPVLNSSASYLAAAIFKTFADYLIPPQCKTA